MNEAFKRVENKYLVILVAISMTLLHKYVSITCGIPGTRTEYRPLSLQTPSHPPPVNCSLHFHSRDNSYIMWYNISIWVSILNSNNNLDASEVCLRTLSCSQCWCVSRSSCQSSNSFVKSCAPNFCFVFFFLTIERLG